MTARNAGFFIGTAPALNKLAGEVRRLDAVQQVVLNTVPAPLFQACRAGVPRAGVLILWAENGAVATKLKQLTPRLLTSFRKERIEVTAIQIRVQAGAGARPRQPRPQRILSLESIGYLKNLGGGLEDSALKQAVLRLAGRREREETPD